MLCCPYARAFRYSLSERGPGGNPISHCSQAVFCYSCSARGPSRHPTLNRSPARAFCCSSLDEVFAGTDTLLLLAQESSAKLRIWRAHGLASGLPYLCCSVRDEVTSLLLYRLERSTSRAGTQPNDSSQMVLASPGTLLRRRSRTLKRCRHCYSRLTRTSRGELRSVLPMIVINGAHVESSFRIM